MEAIMSESHVPGAGEAHSGSAPFSRRSFLSTAGAAGLASAVSTSHVAGQAVTTSADDHAGDEGSVAVNIRVNGKEHRVRVDPRRTLLDCLNDNLALTGTKKGCDHGQCGACTVHVNGRRVLSCLSLAVMHEGDEVTTIEGIGEPGKLHAVQTAFLACDAYQCGYCTPGQIMSAVALMKEPCGPDDADVREFMSGNLCRCGAYVNILAAIQQARGNA
jgi:xanthine dehydrogenase YagT iron-sulfur-binding subunit